MLQAHQTKVKKKLFLKKLKKTRLFNVTKNNVQNFWVSPILKATEQQLNAKK